MSIIDMKQTSMCKTYRKKKMEAKIKRFENIFALTSNKIEAYEIFKDIKRLEIKLLEEDL